MLSKKYLGVLPRNSEIYPRKGGMEQCNSIILRSGKELKGTRRTEEVGKELELPLEKEKGEKFIEGLRNPRSKLFLDDAPTYVPPIPFPPMLWKHQKYMKSVQGEKEKAKEESPT